MKTTYTNILLVGLLSFLATGLSFGQLTENFDTGLSGSYTTGSQTLNSGVWTTANVYQESSTNARSGYAARLNDDKPESSLTTPEINSGVGEISFWYRELNSGGGTFKVQVSSDGTNFSDVDAQTYSGSTYSQYTYTLNQSGTVYIKILIENQSGHLIIDDFSTTAFTATTTETITLSETTLSGLDYVDGSGPSAEQTFTAEGSNLTDDITLTAPTNFEISTTSGSGFGSSVTLTETSGSVSSTTIYVRLASGLAVDTYSGTLTATSTGATQQDVSLSGEVSAPITLPFTEDFSTGLYSVTLGGEGNDGNSDYFFTTDGTNIDQSYSNITGNFFAGQDIDDGGWAGSASPSQLTWSNIDVSSVSNLNFSCDFASVGGGIDSSDYLLFEYRIDGGSWVDIIAFENTGGSNNNFLEDTDFDGTGDGTQLTSTFSTFTKSLNISGSSLDIRFSAAINSGGEEFAIDNVTLSENTVDPEPTNHVTSFIATADGYNKIDLAWNDNDGTQVADGFLIKANTSGTFTDPTDATDPSVDTDLSDGTALVKVNNGAQAYSFSGLSETTQYYFKIWPYTNSNADIDFKTDGTVPVDNATTDSAPITPSLGDLFITEISDASDFNNEFIELHNTTSNNIDLSTTKLVMLTDGTVWDLSDFTSSAIPANGFAIISRGNNQADFTSEFGTLNANTLFIQGNSGMYFGNGRRWQIFEGGSTETADGVLIDDTVIEVADGDRHYQNIFENTFVNTPDNLANPGELDYFVYRGGVWVNSQAPDGTTSSSDVYFFDDFTASTAIAMNNGGIKPGFILDLNNNDLTINGTFTFQSDENGTAQLAEFTGSITGNVTVERFIPVAAEDTRAFRFLTSAVDSTDPIYDNWQESGNSPAGYGTHITGSTTGANGFDTSVSGNPSMFEFDNNYTNPNDAWSPIDNTNNTNLNAGKAYRLFIRGDRNYDLSSEPADSPNSDVKLRATGSLAVGSQTFSLNPNQDLYSFVGNPYQAIVNMNTVMSNTNTSNVNTNFYWVWDPNMSQRGAYVAVDLSSGALSNPNSIDVSSSEANEFVMPGQSFFVQTLSNGAADLEFTEATKDVSQNPTQVFSDNEITSINLRLYKTADFNNGEMESDALGINFSTDASNAVDQFDAAKFFNPDENLARSQNGELLSIEKRNMPAVNESLALFTNGYTVDNYTFVITLSNLSTDATAYLVDAYTGDQILLSDGENQISFSVDQNIPGSIVTDRFSITFDVDTFGVDDQQLTNDFKVYPNPLEDEVLSIQAPGWAGEANISMYNMIGQRVFKTKEDFSKNGQLNVNIGNHQTGVYFIELKQDGQTIDKKLIIK